MAYYQLRDIAINRVTHGMTMPQLYRGEIVSTKTVFSDRLLIAMLEHLRPVAGAPAANGARRPLPDPGIAYAAAIGAFAEAVETGEEPEVPLVDDGTGPDNGPTRVEVRAQREHHEMRAKMWLHNTGEELTAADLADEMSMEELDADVHALFGTEKTPAFV